MNDLTTKLAEYLEETHTATVAYEYGDGEKGMRKHRKEEPDCSYCKAIQEAKDAQWDAPGATVKVQCDDGVWRKGTVTMREVTEHILEPTQVTRGVELRSGPLHLRTWVSNDATLIRPA